MGCGNFTDDGSPPTEDEGPSIQATTDEPPETRPPLTSPTVLATEPITEPHGPPSDNINVEDIDGQDAPPPISPPATRNDVFGSGAVRRTKTYSYTPCAFTMCRHERHGIVM